MRDCAAAPDARESQGVQDANIPILASPLARYITVEVIHIDGGMHRFAG